MNNLEVDPLADSGLIPAGVELDRRADRCLASLVGFRFLDLRLHGRQIPFRADFDEVNLSLTVEAP